MRVKERESIEEDDERDVIPFSVLLCYRSQVLSGFGENRWFTFRNQKRISQIADFDAGCSRSTSPFFPPGSTFCHESHRTRCRQRLNQVKLGRRN